MSFQIGPVRFQIGPYPLSSKCHLLASPSLRQSSNSNRTVAVSIFGPIWSDLKCARLAFSLCLVHLLRTGTLSGTPLTSIKPNVYRPWYNGTLIYPLVPRCPDAPSQRRNASSNVH